MKPLILLCLCGIQMMLAACGGARTANLPTATPPEPLKTTGPIADMVVASAVVVPARSADLSLTVSGAVKEVSIQLGDHVEAGHTLLALDSPDLEFAVAGAEAELRSAQVRAELQRYSHKELNPAGKFIYLTGPPELRQVADSRVLQARARLAITQAELARSVLRAPFQGTVVALGIGPGELVQPATVVLTLADLDRFQIETTDLSERYVNEVKVGQAVAVAIDALNTEFAGTVIMISPLAETVSGDIVYKVTVEFDEQPAGLRWGMSAEVSIAVH